MSVRDFDYETDRLSIREWHFIPSDDWKHQALEIIVKNILTPSVMRDLPRAWQGQYTLERAREWIEERGDEGTILIVVEKSTQHPIGFIILFESNGGKDLRLGYLLAESAWGKGFATELIQGFAKWCECNGVVSVTSGVATTNKASIRVLEKNHFSCEIPGTPTQEMIYVLRVDARESTGATGCK